MRTLRVLFVIAGIIGVYACSKENETDESLVPDPSYAGILNLPSTPYNYANIVLPNHFMINTPGPLPTAIVQEDNQNPNNPITNAGATLGRVLFYDKILSKNNTISCGNCHRQNLAFGDTAVLSRGFEGGNTRRHSMSLVYSRYYKRGHFFWDERAQTLEDQVLMPIQDGVEMGLTLTELQQKVSGQSYYPSLFKAAFGTETITTDLIAKALAQFVRSIVSYSSKYDQGRSQVNAPGAPFPNFTAEENQGKQLFFQPVGNGGAGCFGCHTTEAFINPAPGPINNGLDENSTNDFGAYETTPQPRFLGAFKVPSLRGISQRPPYMHDGRFKTLAEVIEHYNSGVKNHPNLAPALRDSTTGQPIKLHFSESQKAALVAFLNTLSDDQLSKDVRWSDPFIRH